MLARGAIRRLAADLSQLPSTSTHDLPRLSQLLRSGLLSRNGFPLPAARALSTACHAALSRYRRSYTTAAQKTQPTARVKRDVKKAAAKKPAKKTATKASTRRTAKKPAAKRARAKPKKKAAKRAPKPRKELTPEQKEKAKLAELKKKALRTPNSLMPVSAWNAYAAQLMAQAAGQPSGSTAGKMKEAAAQYKLLTPAEKEHWNHIANQSTATKRAEYEAWIRSFTPEQIRVANRARAALKKYEAAGKKLSMGPRNLRHLHDDRQIKMPGNSYALFFKERQLSGDFKGIPGKEAAKLIGNEWRALSASEKEKYKAESAAKHATYQQEKQKVYGHT